MALIAVVNKLLKQAFAIATGQTHHKKSATNQPQITRFFTNLPIDQFIRSQKINGKRMKFVEISVIRG
jgi:hypothetical protein